ncbi:hypothetical protein IEE84_01905 [Psychrobacter sp. 28M-43]|uniref:HNH endonuclease n=1 Tax=Psychrobacter sp. 28M-43 TaxID=2772254 RepID=UPI00168CBE53|nr:HNH endonuclease [Psychrobacter sp. 28M-43]QOD13087.1 hypothetical protein IEE84_01905 [Psychrobacter sp. 28M-43]
MDADISKYKKLYASYNKTEVSYPITYSKGEHKVSDRLSHKRLSKKIAGNMEEYVSIFDNRDYLSLDRDTYIYPFEGSVKKCVFCLKSEPYVSFENRPHVIPEFLGNKHLLHYDECDQCNSEFGNTIERELSEYLRPRRVFSKIKGKKRKYISTYSKNEDNGFEFSEEKNSYIIPVDNNLDLKFEDKEFTYVCKVAKYTPINIYKGLMKILYGLLPREHRMKFEVIRNFLIDNKLDKISDQIPIKVVSTFMPYNNLSSPYINILHRSKNTSVNEILEEDFFEYVGTICFGNTIIEIPMYCDNDIEKAMNRKNISLKLIPKPYGSFQEEIEELNGRERIESEYPLNFGYNSITGLD